MRSRKYTLGRRTPASGDDLIEILKVNKEHTVARRNGANRRVVPCKLGSCVLTAPKYRSGEDILVRALALSGDAFMPGAQWAPKLNMTHTHYGSERAGRAQKREKEKGAGPVFPAHAPSKHNAAESENLFHPVAI